MNLAQMEAAKKNMVIWLSDPHELGREPRKIEYAGNFELHDMRYYFFKFKPGLLGPWLIGVSGGYESDTTLEPCGHTFSNMKKYHASTAESDCIKMIEMRTGKCRVAAIFLSENSAAKRRCNHFRLYLAAAALIFAPSHLAVSYNNARLSSN